MNWRLSLTLLLLLGAIATGWSVWRMSHPADDGVLRTRPDYVLRDYEITALDKQGKPGRETALARTKIEEAVMWAVKGITG